MKTRIKIFTIVLTILLFAQVVFPVQAKGENKKPDPAFRDKAAWVDKSHVPYFGRNALVNIYLADGLFYSVDAVSRDVVEIEPVVMDYQIDATYSGDQLKGMAENLVARFFGDKVKLDKLSFSLGQKIGTFFFRWEDTKKQLDDGSYPFIQVGFSQNGDFLNLYNTLPFGHDNITWSGTKVSANILLIGPFNEIYANGGAYWTGTGGWTSTTGGYYYLHPSGCSGTFCSKFYYTQQSTGGGGLIYGNWWPNYNTNTKAAVFVPGTYATAVVNYEVVRNNGSYFFTQVNQNAYYNTWVSITSSAISNGIDEVSLNNYGTTANFVAWDEVWVYNP